MKPIKDNTELLTSSMNAQLQMTAVNLCVKESDVTILLLVSIIPAAAILVVNCIPDRFIEFSANVISLIKKSVLKCAYILKI